MEVAALAFLVVGVLTIRSGLLTVVMNGNPMPLVAGFVFVALSLVSVFLLFAKVVSG